MRQHRFLGQFQHGNRMFAAYRREILQEVVECVPFLKVIEKSLDRNPGAGEYDGPAHNLVRACDKGLRKSHVSLGFELN